MTANTTTQLGNPVWIDFGSNDFEASKKFYTDLFGWTFEDGGEQVGHYNMIRKDGALVGGAMNTAGMTCPEGGEIPSSWDIYLSVADVDATVERATGLGAQVIVPAGDAGPAGRFAVLLDPTGASIGLWQAGDTTGFEFTGQPGTPMWFELLTQDFAKSTDFYGQLVGFNPVRLTEPMDDDDNRYATNGPQDQASYGICDVAGFVPESEGSFWRVYFGVENTDHAVPRIQELGGKLLDGPVDSPFGRIATIADPQGATFQIVAPGQAVPEGR